MFGSYKNKNPGFFRRDSFILILIVSVLTKASRSISKIVAKVKETGICFCDDHCGAKVSYKMKTTNLFFNFCKKNNAIFFYYAWHVWRDEC